MGQRTLSVVVVLRLLSRETDKVSTIECLVVWSAVHVAVTSGELHLLEGNALPLSHMKRTKLPSLLD